MTSKKSYLKQLGTIFSLMLLTAGPALAMPQPGRANSGMGNLGNPDPPGAGVLFGPGPSGRAENGQDTPGANFGTPGLPQLYGPFSVDTAADPFVDPVRFNQVTGLTFIDEDQDGICDYYQDTPLFRNTWGREWVDDNQDGIADLFQTHRGYQAMGMANFVDVDGDGLCDNYELLPRQARGPGNFKRDTGPQLYQPFEIDTGDDLFVSPLQFEQRTGLAFVDENGDSICDYFQEGSPFRQLGIGAFVDANGDGIGDSFQTREMYWALGLNNFVDVDGDGLCDNYEDDPFAVSSP